MLMERERLQDYQGNGEKAKPTFSAKEMQRRQDAVRKVMAELKIDAALFTSYHNICYLSDFLFCYFGRRYGLLIDHNKATSISAGIDGGQPWRRTFGNNITYTINFVNNGPSDAQTVTVTDQGLNTHAKATFSLNCRDRTTGRLKGKIVAGGDVTDANGFTTSRAR